MRVAADWKDYEIIDTSNGEKLERWGKEFFIRPDPQVIWHTPHQHPSWNQIHAHYHRSNSGGGSWEFLKPIQSPKTISYKGLRFKIEPTGFKHMGLFPEQAVNWDYFRELIQSSERPIQVLNLFSYTGGATLACAAAGASVCHVDASKGIVSWARENAVLSKLSDRPIRWIIDDCEKFVMREIRRGRKYDAIIMDPPSYGRGPGGEVWKLEDKIYDLTEEEVKIIADIIENGTWNTEGTAECANDCKLIIDERTYYYHSECGTFNDKENNQNLPVTAEEKESINAILAQYITLGLE